MRLAKQETGNTTNFIAKAILTHETRIGGALQSTLHPLDAITLEPIVAEIQQITQDRGSRAMTAALFSTSPLGQKMNPDIEGAIRRALSGLYVLHYITHFHALTISGIPGLNYYEQGHSEPLLGFRLLYVLAKTTGIADFLENKEAFGRKERMAFFNSVDRQPLLVGVNRLSVVARGLVSPDPQAKFDWAMMPRIIDVVRAEFRALP